MRLPSGRHLVRTGFLVRLILGLAASAHAGGPTGFTVDPTAREQARVLYNTVYQASENVPSGWTGNVGGGVAGTTSAAFKDAIQLRVNYFRAMAGVPSTVTFSDAFSAECQQAALMMSANSTLSHAPGTDWQDYTAAGADAAGKSNLALGTFTDGPAAINGYLADAESNNTAAGHRRWMLYPPETTMGTGDVDGTGSTLAANALYILDQATFANPAPVPRDGFVAWPPPGCVPYPLLSPRWSFSLPGADFSAATVAMTRQGGAVSARLEALVPGAGDNTLVWVVDGEDPAHPPVPTAPAAGQEVATDVTVANVRLGGAARSFTYRVTPIDPAATGADTILPTLRGPSAPAVGAASTYTFNAVPAATGYHWQAMATAALALDLTPANGSGNATITPAGAPLVTADGTSYQFTSAPAETLTLDAAFVPGAGGALTFHSKLGYASADESAHVQISTDGGATWADVYALAGAGTGGPTETAWAAHVIALDPYAGKVCRARLRYAYDGSGVYFPRGDGTGWYVDDIGLTGVAAVAAADTALSGDLAAGQLAFALTPAAGDYALQVTPVYFGQYQANAGPVLMVTAGAAAGSGVVTVAATTPQAHGGAETPGVFTLTRVGGDLSRKIVVQYTVGGNAVGGTDYAALSGRAKIKANRTSAAVAVAPAGGGTGKVRLVVQPGSGYSVGNPSGAAVKIRP